MEPALWGTELHHFPIGTKSKIKLRNHLKKRKEKKPTHYFIEAKFSSFFYQKVLTAEKGFHGDCLPKQTFLRNAQLRTDLECAILFAKRFSTIGLPKPIVQSFTTTFFCGSKLTTTLLEKDVSQYVWLFVSLWCSLERKDCKERKAGKERLHFLCIFSLRGVCLKNNNPKAGYYWDLY